jgi:polyisoprenoid-binding protein YceI
MKTCLAIVTVLGACTAGFGANAPLAVDKAHSEFDFEVKATMHSFTGKVSDYDAQLVADAETQTIKEARVRFSFAAAQTGDKKRDREMLEWEENSQYPDVVFVLSSLAAAGQGRYNAVGQLTFHGVTKVVSFPVALSVTNEHTYSVDGDTDIDVREYGLPIIRKFGMLKVQPVVKVRFHLQASPPHN